MGLPDAGIAGDGSAGSEPSGPALRRYTQWQAGVDWPAAKRIREARAAKSSVVKELFSSAKVNFPPAQLLFRVFKRERRLEVWASSAAGQPLTHVSTYEVCSLSGELGPKRREGDGQVPEGYYRIAYLWPLSAFHMSMNIGYPNGSDRALGGPNPGSAIMIHGNCVSIGCVAMSDERIQELWVMAESLQTRGNRVHVHIFPARDMAGLLTEDKYRTHRPFWRNLREGLVLFERTRRLPRVRVAIGGRYVFTNM